MSLSSVVGSMAQTWPKALLAFLISTKAFAFSCAPSSYLLQGKALCFSKEEKAYFSNTCSEGKCSALDLKRKASAVDRNKLPADSRSDGSKICTQLGGTTLVAKSAEGHQLCVCIAADQSAVSCQHLAL